MIPTDNAEPVNKKIYRERVEFVGVPNTNDVSIKIWNVTFEDAGQYICFGKNPKEKGKNHSAYFTLYVVDECEWCFETCSASIILLLASILFSSTELVGALISCW